jgi:enoyl-CoA hydratase
VGYEDLGYLTVTVADGIAHVTLDRPEKRNAFTAEGHKELSEIYGRLAADDTVRSVLLTGAGDTFSVGPDWALLSALSQPDESSLRQRIMDETINLVHAAVELDKPVVCAINGLAYGMALAVALLSDIIVIERHVSIREGHVLAGLAAGDGGALVWPLAMGLTKAKRYLLTSDVLTADEAERLGIVSEVVERGQSKDRALEFAARFAAGPQLAIRSTKRALNQWLRSALTTTFDYSWALELLTMGTPEAAAAAEALGRGAPGPMPADPRG